MISLPYQHLAGRQPTEVELARHGVGKSSGKDGAKYLVCSHCMKEGKQSWIYEDRVQFRPFCVNCGQAWGDIGPIQRTRPRGLRRVRRQSRPNAAKGDPSRANPRKPRASDAEELLLKSGMTFQMRYAQPLRMQVGLRTVRRGLVSARLEATHLTTAKRRLQSFTSKLMKRLRSCSRWQGFQSLRGPLLRPFKRCIKRTRLTKSTLQI